MTCKWGEFCQKVILRNDQSLLSDNNQENQLINIFLIKYLSVFEFEVSLLKHLILFFDLL